MNKSNSPKLVVEATVAILRWALIFVVVNNALWAAIHFGDFKHSPSNNTEIHMTQDGTGNTQSLATPEAKSN